MNKDTIYQLIEADALITKLYEQLASIANNEPNDGRYRGFVTQSFGLKQDIEDKLREDLIDVAPTIQGAPNIPTGKNNGNGANNPQTPNSNPMGNNSSTAGPATPTQAPTPTQNATTIPNGNTSNDISDLFSSILSGNGNNVDLNDILNQINNDSNNNNPSQNTPF